MRTAVLLGLAAGTLLLAGRASAAEMPLTDSQAPLLSSMTASFGHDGKPQLDYGTPSAPDTRVYTGHPDRVPSEVDYRHVEGTYDAEGRWTGTWNGSYEAPDGRRYDGSYEGTVEGRPGTSYAPPATNNAHHGGGDYRGGFDPRHVADMTRRCGGGATAANDSNRKHCELWWRHGATTVHHQGGYGYGYGWYSPGVIVTTVITTGAPVVTETIETTTSYVTVPVRKRYVAKKKRTWKPKKKARCVC